MCSVQCILHLFLIQGLKEIQLIRSNGTLWLIQTAKSPVIIVTPTVCAAPAPGSSEHFMSQFNHSTQQKNSPSKKEMDLLSSGLVSWSEQRLGKEDHFH